MRDDSTDQQHPWFVLGMLHCSVGGRYRLIFDDIFVLFMKCLFYSFWLASVIFLCTRWDRQISLDPCLATLRASNKILPPSFISSSFLAVFPCFLHSSSNTQIIIIRNNAAWILLAASNISDDHPVDSSLFHMFKYFDACLPWKSDLCALAFIPCSTIFQIKWVMDSEDFAATIFYNKVRRPFKSISPSRTLQNPARLN